MALCMSVQDYLVKYYPVFWRSITGEVIESKDVLSECLYHSDKAYQYFNEWELAGIHPFNGTMLYLLTYEHPWLNEVGLYPSDWVINSYATFIKHLPHPLVPLKQTKLKTDTQRGNCMVTALSIMTDIPISKIPPLETLGEHWHLPFFNWLREVGFSYTPTQKPIGLAIANGMSNRGVMHSIITVDGLPFHDPHPSNDYLETINQYWLIKKV